MFRSIIKTVIFISLIIFLAVFVSSSTFFHSFTNIKVDNPNIEYIGRFDFSKEGIVRFDWSGVQIKTKFSGTYCGIKLKDGKNDYNIFIDGKLYNILKTNADTVYTLAENLSDSVHTLLIVKRTEARNGLVSFEGLILNSGKVLLPAIRENKRKIEFIGDSFVAGLGSEGKTPDCVFNRDNENSYIAFGPVLARKLNADYSIIAVSGIGIVRNFGDKSSDSPKTLQNYFERTCFNEDLKWDFKKWQPDLVVVRVGNNDYWHKPYPIVSEFQNAYSNFLKQIRNLYPNSSILVLCEPVRKDPHCDYIKNVVTAFKNKVNDKKIWYKELDIHLDKSKDYGCQEHPNESGHKKIANALEPVVRNAMGWK